MGISSVSGALNSQLSAMAQTSSAQASERTEVRENDGDRDDVSRTSQARAPQPTTTLNGQVIGQIINVQA